MNRCPDCLYAVEARDAEWSCHHPRVNRSSPAFLAGRATAAKRCEDERRNVVGQCGTRGRLFAPRAVPALPAPDADA